LLTATSLTRTDRSIDHKTTALFVNTSLRNKSSTNFPTIIEMATLPTLLFVPGSWHKPTCYSKIIEILNTRHRFRCVAITLPSTRGDPDATFKDDVDVARAAIHNETKEGRNVVVIAHSYGGMVANSSIKEFTRPQGNVEDATTATSSSISFQRTAQPEALTTGHVIGLVLIASGFTLTGLSFMDPLFGIPPPAWRVNKETGFADIVIPPRDLFYHDVPKDEAEEAVSQLTPQSLKALFEGGEHSYAGWKDVPAWYIGTTEDRGLPVVIQRMQVGMARELGAHVVHRELQSSHSPFLSQPEEVVQILTQAVQAFTGDSSGDNQAEVGLGKAISVPAARLWAPYSWFKFGLPLTFGHILGRCIVIFTWTRNLWVRHSV
jgi:pimeloyl-ACP methyl ester carboxylesterase